MQDPTQDSRDDDSLPTTVERPSRRRFLTCAASWAGTGVVWTLCGGVPRALASIDTSAASADSAAFRFVQISDTHIGFNKPANPDPLATLDLAIERTNRVAPDLILHTGDITHLSKDSEFDTAAQALQRLKAPVHYVPGEHDTLDEGAGQLYLRRYGRGTSGNGWYSFDDHGVHFVGLVNVFGFQASRPASLGADQLKWLAADLQSRGASTPVVIFTHIPLWSAYSPWGWETADGPQALDLLRRFGSVTVLQGHIHQVLQKVEGNITLHTARGTAYPQPAPGTAPSPGPLSVPAEQLRTYLGITRVREVSGGTALALDDETLA